MPLQNSANTILNQLHDAIGQLQPAHFSAPIEVLGGSTIGQHVRHTIEFFICLMDASASGVTSYDQRKHDTTIETDPKFARSIIDVIQAFLAKECTDHPLINETNYELEDSEKIQMASSYFRELAYCIEHAVHHMALINVAIRQQFHYVSLPAHFGVAVSTVRYQQSKEN